ncbi:lipopolysaccharide biosynthesis protein [Mucilaginibacter sp. 22184]|uniref:lipopolysaccharide biosynthesis protein n=1 Tax=Mucilaginibacter sp. 22184 TaxID=3453887 RepID=UPI003F87FE6A
MGIIKKQTIKGTIYSYLGVLIGFLSINYLMPHSLSPAEYGLIAMLTSAPLVFAQFSILGFNGTARYFPYFRSDEKKHHGYLFLACMVSLVGTILFVLIAWLFKDQIVSHNTDGNSAKSSALFSVYYWYLVPLTVFTLFFNVFDLYARMLYNMTTGLILREFTKRVFILVPIVLVYLRLISFESFMWLWLVANLIPTFFIVARIIRDGQFSLKPDMAFLTRDMVNKLIGICFFTILTGMAPVIIQNVDNYLIFKKLGLSSTAIYSLAFNFGLIISLPTRSLYSIAYTIVSESWKSNDLKNIRTVYEKSCVTQLIASLFLFILMWASIDNILGISPHIYSAGKYAIFFVSMGFLIEASTGINGVIMATSKYFRYEALFNLLLVVLIIVANLLLIPRYGITGSAIASAITYFVFNLFRYIFIWIKFGMQPFTIQCVLALATGILAYYLSAWILPLHVGNYYVDTMVRTAFITALYLPAVYFLKLSEDINSIIDGAIAKLKGR